MFSRSGRFGMPTKNPEHFHVRDSIFMLSGVDASNLKSLIILYSALDAPKVRDRVFGAWQSPRDR
ncbi:hypothetical protein Aconfl_09620 [Algoriphagus confluentis]|uniref:Uncharacterized protein n=1 Tax=Algoriphagus confluentis TaxID=1697556 RepID=A0ABQ6PK20_9BACT|nr:hypothetical protein Aconfl_09620 [Algoriphagus confluentis]